MFVDGSCRQESTLLSHVPPEWRPAQLVCMDFFWSFRGYSEVFPPEIPSTYEVHTAHECSNYVWKGQRAGSNRGWRDNIRRDRW